VHHVFGEISEKYDLMNDLESFGLHRAWKRALVEQVAKLKPKSVLDVATGTGDIAFALTKRCPDAQVVGFDFSEAMLAVAKKRAAGTGQSGTAGAEWQPEGSVPFVLLWNQRVCSMGPDFCGRLSD
jgi:demethylmenaquinone methyltransferase/2-methoxy-6-polyprenyl-1,4-benzoquinol methylase